MKNLFHIYDNTPIQESSWKINLQDAFMQWNIWIPELHIHLLQQHKTKNLFSLTKHKDFEENKATGHDIHQTTKKKLVFSHISTLNISPPSSYQNRQYKSLIQ